MLSQLQHVSPFLLLARGEFFWTATFWSIRSSSCESSPVMGNFFIDKDSCPGRALLMWQIVEGIVPVCLSRGNSLLVALIVALTVTLADWSYCILAIPQIDWETKYLAFSLADCITDWLTGLMSGCVTHWVHHSLAIDYLIDRLFALHF